MNQHQHSNPYKLKVIDTNLPIQLIYIGQCIFSVLIVSISSEGSGKALHMLSFARSNVACMHHFDVDKCLDQKWNIKLCIDVTFINGT